MIRRLRMKFARRRHRDFSIRSRPFWTLASLVIVAGILSLPALLYAAIGETRLTAVPATWWDVGWIVGALLAVGLLGRVVMVSSAAAVSGLVGQRLGRTVSKRNASKRRENRAKARVPSCQVAGETVPRSAVAAASDAHPSADAVCVSALVLVLSARLRAALGPEFRVSVDELGQSIELGHGFNTRRIVIPFGRFRLLSAAEAVCLTCRIVLSGAQHFAMASLGEPWPVVTRTLEPPKEAHKARPSVSVREGLVRLSWRSESGPVLCLSPIVLADLVDRKLSRCPSVTTRRGGLGRKKARTISKRHLVQS